MPPVRVVPEKLVSEPDPPTAKVLPAPTARVPSFVKLPAVVKLRPPKRLKLPAVATVVSPTRASLLSASTREPLPVRMMVAASFTISPPVVPNWSISKVPAVL